MARNLKVISVPGPAMCSRPCGRDPSGNRGGTRFNLISFAPCDGGMMRGRLCGSEKNANTLGTGTGIHCSMCRRLLMALGDAPNILRDRVVAKCIAAVTTGWQKAGPPSFSGAFNRLDCRFCADNFGFLPELP